MKVFLMRGIPGSGKSTWIGYRHANPAYVEEGRAVVCSADYYHMVDGKYDYKPENARRAHNECRGHFLELVRQRPDTTVVVDNTNLHAWELAFYIGLCEIYGIKYEIITVYCDPIKAAKRNVHGVPFQKVMQMYTVLMNEKLPTWWSERAVTSE